ncbi:MAG: PEP-CTERM system histidine kinase PrsK [gamma proteobacterium endosymbiont of Lamellibrachia anaximandri]|nr:PEP-CTERM system histidine kinase PrsK [gamma proteobacterium endosymbiont of Lamellibrachia anaximandri]MBL3618970.1 PEP-CTERM system histidine kinase PrsK [gamma proteobacterium endosymbiont of Lamellibrachia anaximandri]
MSVGIIGYSLAALFFFLFSALLLTSWRGRIEGIVLLSAVTVTAFWGLSAVFLLLQETALTVGVYFTLEVARNIAWFVFLLRLLQPLLQSANGDVRILRFLPAIVLGVSIVLFGLGLLASNYPNLVVLPMAASLQLFGHLGFAITGLTLVEQLFRNTRLEQRWAVKYLYFGIGALFVFDFFLYADALLFKQIDSDLWQARGFINALVVPMLVVAAARNPSWSVKIFISRKAVFHTTGLLGAGVYLLIMSAVGYYIRFYGGSWGKAAQVIFLFMAIATLTAILFSSHLRSRVKVFLSKHFFRYKYDYREEWLRIIHTLSDGEPGPRIRERVIKAVADLVDSGGGILWLRDDSGNYPCVSHWQAPLCQFTVMSESSLVDFFIAKDWIIDLEELKSSPALYEGLKLPDWVRDVKDAWLLVPIRHHGDLLGFLVLIRPRSPRQINWEDRDLLKTASQQAASYLALMQASEALARANQFEAFNRLSAFVVHDLKNLVAQLELVVTNAARHKNNPEFMEDAIRTVDNAANKMSRLLAQLRKGRFEKSNAQVVLVAEALQEAAREHAGFLPRPELAISDEEVRVVADKDRFAAVIGHLIKNAQEATPDDGYVRLAMCAMPGQIEITIEDNGSGMDDTFIRDHLFQPFETTKGNAGMGVGVYESREFVRALGGQIAVTSRIGKGTKFSVTLPIRIEEEEDMQMEISH